MSVLSRHLGLPASRPPLLDRLEPFHYRRQRGAGPRPAHQAAPPPNWEPQGGCVLPQNRELYVSPSLGNAQRAELVMVGTDLAPATVQQRGGLFPPPAREHRRGANPARCDANGLYRGLGGHVTGHHRRGYQSTTRRASIAIEFANRRGCQINRGGYVYSVFASGIDVAQGRAMDLTDKSRRATTRLQRATLGLRLAWSSFVTNWYAEEDELAVPDGVPVDDVVGFRATQTLAGGWDGRFVGPNLVDPHLPDAWYNRVGLQQMNRDERAILTRSRS